MYDVLFFIDNKYSNTHAQYKEINEKEDDSNEPSSFSYDAVFFNARRLPGRQHRPEDLPGR